MSAQYTGEKLITLSEGSKKYGYTSDHLAYLCRKGLVWAKREGKIWKTCEKAIENYKTGSSVASESSPYDSEKLITLSEGSKKYGYTSDHLAYLCRKGLVWAKREGKIWKTCEKAIEDYQGIETPVSIEQILEIFRQNNDEVKKVIIELIKKIDSHGDCFCHHALEKASVN